MKILNKRLKNNSVKRKGVILQSEKKEKKKKEEKIFLLFFMLFSRIVQWERTLLLGLGGSEEEVERNAGSSPARQQKK